MEDIETQFLAVVEKYIGSSVVFLTELGPLVLGSATLGVAMDSRSFARVFEESHALIIRECTHLEDGLGLLKLENKNEKSGRVFFDLTEKAQGLIKGII